MARLGEDRQVMSVTHLPQVAAHAHHHWVVNKLTQKGRTHSHIQKVEHEERVREIAGKDPLDELPGTYAHTRPAALLAAHGVAVPKGVSAPDLAGLDASALAAPFVLKGLGFAHKTEAGAVRLGLTSLESQSDIPGATGYLVEEMVTGVVAELLVGLRRDPVYGATLTLGFGGVTAELLADTQTLVLPVTAEEVDGALRRLRLWPLLDGYRGRARADTGAVVAAVMALQSLLKARDDIEEIEINPLMVRAQGAVAVDAVIWEADT